MWRLGMIRCIDRLGLSYCAHVAGEVRTLCDGALVANNPTHMALLEVAEMTCAANEQQQGGGGGGGGLLGITEVAVVVSLGCGQSAPGATLQHLDSSGGAGGAGGGGLGSLSRHRDLLGGLFNLMTDTDSTHEVVRRVLRCEGKALGEEYHRLNTILDERHMRIDESGAGALRAMQLLTRDYLRREKSSEVARLIAVLRSHHPGARAAAAAAARQRGAGARGGESDEERRLVVRGGAPLYHAAGLNLPLEEYPAAAAEGRWLSPEDARRWQDSFYDGGDIGATAGWTRGVRKQMARMTGLSGFFSGKRGGR